MQFISFLFSLSLYLFPFISFPFSLSFYLGINHYQTTLLRREHNLYHTRTSIQYTIMRNFWIVIVFLLALLSSFGSAAPSINVGPSPALPSVNVTRFATIGDSYASGVGAGKSISSRGLKWKPNKNWDCSRFSNSYGRLVWKDPRLDSLYGTRDNREFDYKACTGAKARHVDQQLKKLGEGQYDVVSSAIFSPLSFSPSPPPFPLNPPFRVLLSYF